MIRKETPGDYDQVRQVVQSAFPFRLELGHHDFNEWIVIERTRGSQDYIPELSLVAEVDGAVVGHILFTPMKIKGDAGCFDSLALAPVSVHQDFQNRGIGTQLCRAGIETAKQLGYKSMVVMGHPGYYPRFGFKPASGWRIGMTADCNDDCLFAMELAEGGLAGVNGIVEYCPSFYNEKGELI